MKLAAYLKQHGLTLDQFAQQIERSAASVSRLTNDKQKPDWDTMVAIEQATKGQVTAIDFLPEIRPFRSGTEGENRLRRQPVNESRTRRAARG